jgi:hypothetical protein
MQVDAKNTLQIIPIQPLYLSGQESDTIYIDESTTQ